MKAMIVLMLLLLNWKATSQKKSDTVIVVAKFLSHDGGSKVYTSNYQVLKTLKGRMPYKTVIVGYYFNRMPDNFPDTAELTLLPSEGPTLPGNFYIFPDHNAIKWMRTINKTQKAIFLCPVKEGEMIDIEKAQFNKGDPAKAILLASKDGNIYSCSDGVIKYLSRKDSSLSVAIDFNEYSFVYMNLKSCAFSEGQTIKEGSYIGSLATGKNLYLRIYINDSPVMPHKFLKCLVTK